MSMRTVLIVTLALVCGVSATVGVNIWQQAQGHNRPSKGNTVEVVVADKSIPRFTIITASMLKTQEYPKDLVPPGAFTSVADVAGRVSTTQLQAGEVLLDGKISGKDAGRGMAVAVPLGMRAFTIRTPNIASGVAGFILPGNRVDVLLTLADSRLELTGGAITTTLLQNIEILAVDQVIDTPAGNKVDPNQLRSVTLLVSPEEAAQLELGQDKGSLHLSLRSHADSATVATRPVTLREIQLPPERRKQELAAEILAVAHRNEVPLPLPRVVEEAPVVKLPQKEKEATTEVAAVEVLPWPRIKPEEPPLPPIQTLRGVDASQVEVK